MNYQNLYEYLQKIVNYDDLIAIDNQTNLYNFTFTGDDEHFLSLGNKNKCTKHNFLTQIENEYENKIHNPYPPINISDNLVPENRCFKYHVFHKNTTEKAKDVILLFHGFNEKTWDKYLPWAKRLNELTGKAVVLFPISFHMNRAPAEWSDRRIMYKVANEREKYYPHIEATSLFNVAISLRLHIRPQRFIYSGLQTFYDVKSFIDDVRASKIPIIDADANFDIFAYSIGCLLGEILMMANPKNYFENSKIFMFCGGPVFNRLSPVSKFILDSEANVSLYSFIVEHLENYLKTDPQLAHYLSELHPEGIFLRSMLNYTYYRKFREETLGKIGKRIMAVGLEQDIVIPSYEIVNTLKGANHNLPTIVEVMDFDYPYKHEDPFPVRTKYPDDVNKNFEKVMEKAANFFLSKSEHNSFFSESSFVDLFRKFIKF